MHASDKNSAASHPYSAATCGSRRPRYGLLFESLRDLNRTSCAPQNVGVEGFARDANRAFAFAVGIRHPPRQQDAYLNIVGAILRLSLATSLRRRLSLTRAPCEWSRNLYRPRPLIHRGRSCALGFPSSKS